MRRTYVVVGLGQFGEHVARRLSEAGGEVLAERLRKYGGVKIETKDVSNSTDLSKELPA